MTRSVVIGWAFSAAAVAIVACRPWPANDAPGPAVAAREARGAQTPERFDSGRAWEHLRQMVSFGPRPSGSAALRQKRAYITRQLAAAGLTVREQPFTAQTPKGAVEMANLLVPLPGRRQEKILISGHYDTKIIRDSVFVGANDGASSAAMLIELARVLNDRPREFTWEIVWFDGEEAVCIGWTECRAPDGSPDNTYGSRHYVQAARQAGELSSIRAMILLDMVGARDLKVRRDTQFSAPWLVDLVWARANALGYGSTFLDAEYPVGGDDHQAFAEAGIPTVDIIDLADFPQWHNLVCCDDLEHVSARSLQIVGEVVLASLPEIEKRLVQR